MTIFGVKPAIEALRAGLVTALAVSVRRRRGLTELLELADRCRVRLRRVDPAELDRLAGGAAHQGVVATVRALDTYAVADLVAVRTPALILVLDGIEDPRNLGAIARTVDAAGGSGLVVPERRAAPITGAAVKASAGALVHVPLAPVVNLPRALEELKAAGVWTIGLEAEADQSLYDLDLRLPSAFVIGGEGRGLHRLVRERCDWRAALPMRGRVSSLNVSVAAALALFEAVRQRSAAAPAG
ncbi:MAG: 23S rRNA (guanosine(2251)-2'-O)-methyltransferase RlmB [Acidobacteria bacterium]|nr:23S rRNA (guanosine(2251)-2'-O)-methyltransferase RlmB [Acidobacteriota bacterium]